MKRLLSLILCAVMLFSVLGAEAWAADGDTLTVFTKSGGRRSVRVGDTFTYSYALRILGTYQLDRVWLDVVFDDACLEYVSAEFPNFEGATVSRVDAPGDLRVEHGYMPNGAEFSKSILTLVTVTFRAKRAGTTYISTMPERLEAEAAKESDVYLVDKYRANPTRNNFFSTYDYLGTDAPNNSTTKLNTSQDVVWFYVTDKATGESAAAGQTFSLRGTDENGKLQDFTAVSDAYGLIAFPKTPFGNYVLSCTSALEDGSAYSVIDPSVQIPMLSGGKLSLRRAVSVRALQPDQMRDITISLRWANEFIEPGVKYTEDRPASVSMDLEANGVSYARTFMNASDTSVLLKNMPLVDEEGNALSYVIQPGNVEHYEATYQETDEGFDVTMTFKNDHDWEKETITEPDCEANGEMVYTCADCGKIYHRSLAPLGHDYAVDGYDATCTEDGYHLYVCKRCNKWYSETVEAAGHTWGDWIIDEEATETTDGKQHRFCDKCGEREDRVLAGPSHVHTYKTVVVEPTCTEEGVTKDVCGCGREIIEEGSRVPALGHTYTGASATTEIIQNGCTEDGLAKYTCTRCGKMHAEALPAHGHNYGVIEKKAATCTEAGYTKSECSYCGDPRTIREAPLGHDFGEWVIDIPATGTTPGSRHRVCKRCLKEENESIPIIPSQHTHHYDDVETVAPTCTEKGYTKYSCPDDGASYIDPDSYVDPLGHDWKEDWRTESTTRTRGVICFKCAACGTLRYEAMPKKEGTWTNKFADVREKDWFYSSVRYVAYNEYMAGVSSTRFDPNGSMTRAMLVTVLYRMVGTPSVSDLSMPFKDVPSGSSVWYHDAVLWAYHTGVVKGTSETLFSPDTLITREQMVTIFQRYADYAGYDTSAKTSLLGFADAGSVSAYAKDALAWAVNAKIINGVAEGGVNYLQPQGTATRAQAAAIIQRFDDWRLK